MWSLSAKHGDVGLTRPTAQTSWFIKVDQHKTLGGTRMWHFLVPSLFRRIIAPRPITKRGLHHSMPRQVRFSCALLITFKFFIFASRHIPM
jgi:hypothetical protein